MRVLLDARVGAGGVGRYARTLASGLRDTRAETEVKLVDYRSFGYKLFSPWGRRAVGRLGDSWGADVVHGLHLELAPSRATGIVTIHDLIPLLYPDSMPNPVRRRLFSRIVRQSAERATAVIAPSFMTRDDLVRFGIAREKIEVIPLAADDIFTPTTPDEVDLARRRFGGGKPYVASVVSDRPHKNVAGLSRAARIIRETLNLSTVACGPAMPGTGPLSFVNGLSDQDLRFFFGGAVATIVPSTIEGFGLPIVEAMACGSPVICGPRVGAVDFVHRGVTVVDTSDAAAMAAAIAALASDEAGRDRESAAAAESAAMLRPGRMATSTLELYQRVVK
jgi:alpha-1,3-rhamnosyl/mannosyltransferase